MKRLYKNTIDFSISPDPAEQRHNLVREIVQHSDYVPEPVTYEDIDRSFKEWVEKNLVIIQDGKELPTMSLYSNQRFSEYMQTWQYTDENNNIRLNFKTVTRENNPSHGTIHGSTFNTPGGKFYTFKSIPAIDESGKKYRIDYKMRQPTAVDFKYKVSVMTNRYTTLNEFNEQVQLLFNSLQNYVCPKGHFMSMILDNISDESEYNISDRQFFSQSFNVTLKGYIIREEDIKIEENPIAAIICFEGDTAKRKRATVELSEYDPCYVPEERYYKKPISIDIVFNFCKPCLGKTPEFNIGENFVLSGITDTVNVIEDTVSLIVNGEILTENLIEDLENNVLFEIGEHDFTQISVERKERTKISEEGNVVPYNEGSLTLHGYNRLVVYDKENDNPETTADIVIEEEREIFLKENECK